MNYLKNRRVYIGGPIEHDDLSVDWRTPVKNSLKDFGLKIFDPYDDPKQALRKEIQYYKEHEMYDELRRVVRSFVRMDLSIVDRADFVVMHCPYKTATTGTVSEILNSNQQRKPTLLVCPQGKQKLPDWYFGCIPHRFMFGSWDALYTYLHEVNTGKHKNDDRWFFVYNSTKLEWL